MLEFTQIGFLEDPIQRCAEIAAREPLRPYLFVGSTDDEVDAFVSAADGLRFEQPAEDVICGGMKCASKRSHMAHLLADGKNVAIKGSLFNYCDDAMLKTIWYSGYTLISIGDSILWSDKISKFNAANIEEAVRRKQLIAVAQDTFLLSAAHKAEYVLDMLGISQFTYNDRLLTRLTASGRTAMYWTPQPLMMKAFRRAHIVHYMPAASPLAAYMNIFGVRSEVEEGGRQQDRQLASLLRIDDDEKYNSKGADPAAYTVRWYARDKAVVDEVFKDMRNVLVHSAAGSEMSSLIAYALPNTTLETIDISKLRPVFRGRGFPAIPAADCGEYTSARVLCYCANTNFPTASAKYFRDNRAAFDQDAYALYHMLRWISRSAVRGGEPVTVYVPSKYMRGLLEDWINKQMS